MNKSWSDWKADTGHLLFNYFYFSKSPCTFLSCHSLAKNSALEGISSFKFWVHTLLGKIQSMSGPPGGGQYTHSITMWQLVNYECINCTHWYMTTVVILFFWFASLNHNSIFMNAGPWCILCQAGRNHIFSMHVFVLSVLVVLFWAGALNWVMVPDSTGIYVGSVGWCDIYCKFLSTFRECVLPTIGMHIFAYFV